MASALHMRTNPATASSPWTRPAAATAMQSDLMQSDLNAGLLQLLNQLAGLQAPQQIPQLQTVAAAVAAQQAPLPPPHFFAPPAAPALAALPGLRLGMGLGASSSIAQPAAGATASGTSSDRLPLGGDATTELEAANSVAGLKLPVTCNDIRGVVYLDQQVVACYCPACEQRVASGHGRPLFSFTRFERHSGSKAKKWRLSIRIDPGAVKEAPLDEPPLTLGQWLDSKGLVSWAPRGGLKIGPSGGGGGGGAGSSDDEGSPYGEDSGGGGRRQSRPSGGALARQATIGPRGGAPYSGVDGILAASAAAGPLGKRPRAEYETPDLPSHANRQQWLESQREAFNAAAATAAASSDAASGGGGGGGDSSSTRLAAQHSAIFALVYGLLEAGEDRRAFNEVYLPWLNELPPPRLEAEFSTLHSYLRLLEGGMGSEVVRGLMGAYVRAIVQKAAR